MTKDQWKAISSRDKSYDGSFYYSLKRSKTFCRPHCDVKRPTPERVIIFDSVEDALNAGLRPCSRCRPDLPRWKGVKHELASRDEKYIAEHYTEKFSLNAIAKTLYIDKIYLSKTFKEVNGETLLACHNRIRCEEAARLLRETVLSVEIISEKVGFSTPSHFTRVFKNYFKTTPSKYRSNYQGSGNRD